MKNYQRVNYRKYYAQDENGEYVEVSRKVCFAPAEHSTEENPFKQRWFYDVEAGYVVRLTRIQANEDLHRFNSSSKKKKKAIEIGSLIVFGKIHLTVTKIVIAVIGKILAELLS